jgi:plastocyanin
MSVSILPGIPAPVRSSEFVVLRSAQGAAKPSASPQPTSSGSSQSPPSAGTAAVTIDNFKFVPACLTVSQDTITLTNRDTTAHTTTADDGKSFDTGNIDPRIFGDDQPVQARDLQYHCNIHPFMHGTLVVKSSSSSTRCHPDSHLRLLCIRADDLRNRGSVRGPTASVSARMSSSQPLRVRNVPRHVS